MLTGEYQHTVDSKGRVFVPAKFRADLLGNLILVKGLDECIVLYNEQQWNCFIEKLEAFGEMQMKEVKRFILASAFNTELDSQGRIVIPAKLREHASIDKDISFVGLSSNVELWNPDKFASVNSSVDPEEMKLILTKVGF